MHGETTIDRLHDGLALIVVLEQIPLVQKHHEGAPAFDGKISDLLVLLGDARGGVDDEQRDVGAIDGTQTAHHGVVLDVLVNGALLADAGGIDHAIALAIAFDHRVDGVTRGACDVAHDGAVVADHLVEQRGLAGVRAPMMATRRVSGSVSSSPVSSGSRATTSSSRSPVPWPCRADTATGSPTPKE